MNNSEKKFRQLINDRVKMMNIYPPEHLMQVVGVTSSANWGLAVDASIAGFKYFSGPISSKSNVLDVGCGCGRLAVSLIGKVNHYTGIEVYKPHILWCQQNLKPASFHHYNINNEMYNQGGSVATIRWPDVKDKSQDIVFLSSVITHLRTQHVIETFDEIKRVIKTGGILIFSCFLQESAKDGINTIPVHAGGPVNNILDEVSWGDSLTNNTYIVYKNGWIQKQLKTRGFNLLKKAGGQWGGKTQEPIKGLPDRYQDWFSFEMKN